MFYLYVIGLTGDVSHVLDRLAEPVPALASPLSKVVTNATRTLLKTQLVNPPIPAILMGKALKVDILDNYFVISICWFLCYHYILFLSFKRNDDKIVATLPVFSMLEKIDFQCFAT